MKPWTTTELRYLIANYNKEPAIYIAAKLGRTKRSVQIFAHAHKLTRDLKIQFTDEENEFIRQNINKLTNRQIAAQLNKTLTVTRNQIYHLGLKRHKCLRGSWTDSENEILIDNYQTKGDVELSSMLPGRTKQAIRKRRITLNLHRTPEQTALLIESGKKKFLQHSYKSGHKTNPALRSEIMRKAWITRKVRKRIQEIKQKAPYQFSPIYDE